MKKYSLLIVGFRCYSGHIKEFVSNLKKKNPLVEITVAVTYDPSVRVEELEKELALYAKKVILYKKAVPTTFRKILKGLYYFYHFFVLYLKGGFDVVNIHYANSSIIPFMPLIQRMTRNVVISPWGSDVLRVDGEKGIKELQKIYECSRYVTTGKDGPTGSCLISKFKVSPEKMVGLSWGGEFFDYIQENTGKVTLEQAKERFGVNGKYVITCGYNTQKEQRHVDIIDAIHKVKEQLPDNLVLLFPFTYGTTKSTNNYIELLKEKCEEKGLNCLFVTEHLDMADLFKLRMATNIFVHVQTTDAGSRCVAEYVLCNKKVIHGSWIKYPYLEDNKPSCYFPVKNMDQLGECILTAYQTPIGELSELVRNILLERGWNKKMTFWNDFFESLL